MHFNLARSVTDNFMVSIRNVYGYCSFGGKNDVKPLFSVKRFIIVIRNNQTIRGFLSQLTNDGLSIN